MAISIATSLVVSLLSAISLFLWWTKSSPIRNWPVIGSLPALHQNSRRIHDFFTQVLKQSYRHTLTINGLWFCNTDYVVTSDPDNVNHILSRNFTNYSTRPKFNTISEPLGEFGVFNAEGERWKFQRRILHSVIRQKEYISTVEKIMTQKLDKCLIKVLDHLSDFSVVVDMQDVLHRFFFDTNSHLLFGYDPGYLSADFPSFECEKAYEDLEEVTIRRHLVPEFIWKLQKRLRIGDEKRFLKAWETCDKFLHDSILRKLRLDSEDFNFLKAFVLEVDKVESKDQISSHIKLVCRSAKFLRDISFSVLEAGRDTVSAALIWSIWLIYTHPSVENKILKEIEDNMDIQTCKDTDKLVYLHAVLCETMRLYPPLSINHKAATEADILPSGHRIGPNSNIVIPFYTMGRMEEIWGEDCLEFKPERWISNKGEIINMPFYKFPAYNGGPKFCLGEKISFTQMKIIASGIVRRYRMQVVEGHPIVPKSSVILVLEHGLKVRIFKRYFGCMYYTLINDDVMEIFTKLHPSKSKHLLLLVRATHDYS